MSFLKAAAKAQQPDSRRNWEPWIMICFSIILVDDIFFFICWLIQNQTLVLNSIHQKLLKYKTKVGFHLIPYAFILSSKQLFNNFFYQLCCLPAKATVILETATSSLVSSPLLLTTNPALRVVSCPHAYSLTRWIPVFFFFFFTALKMIFQSSLTSGTETGGLCSTSARLELHLHLLSYAWVLHHLLNLFFSTFCFFWILSRASAFFLTWTCKFCFWPASKSNRQIT